MQLVRMSKNLFHAGSNLNKHEKTYINEVFSWDYTVYDLLSLSSYNLDKFEEAYKYVKIAIDMNPNDERIKNNLKLIEKKLEI